MAELDEIDRSWVRAQHIEKTRDGRQDTSAMNSVDDYLKTGRIKNEALDIDLSRFIKVAKARSNIAYGEVTGAWPSMMRFATKPKIVSCDSSFGLEQIGSHILGPRFFKFDSVVSTIPLPSLLDFLGQRYMQHRGLISIPATYVIGKGSLGEYDYVYLPHGHYWSHRISKAAEPGKLCLEYAGMFWMSMPFLDSRRLPISPPFDVFKTKYGFPLRDIKHWDRYVRRKIPDNYFLLGRFGEWNHSARIDTVVERAKEITKMIL